jgi:glutamate 5-kinase
MNEYAKAFRKYDIEVAQILLTADVLNVRKTYLNLRHCLDNLLRMRIVPVINENDAVSIAEIDTSFGDNDVLSALVASKLNADLLIVLTDIDGLYTDNPKKGKKAEKIRIVEQVTPQIMRYAGKAGSAFSVGGMTSKVKAAKLATEAGCEVVIAQGREKDVISRIIKGEQLGTRFLAKGKVSAKERFIQTAKPKGKVMINECAVDVLKKGKASLLPVGIDKVEGNFQKGDVVEINSFAKGIVDFSSKDIRKIAGKKSKEAEKILGRKCREVMKKENIVIA